MLGKTIKAFTIFLAFLPMTILAQDSNAASSGSPGCGDIATKFAVKIVKGQTAAQREAGKALIYFIEDDSNFNSIPKPTTRVGVDGKWMGATHGNSFLYFSLDPGVHHLCASWESLAGHRKEAATHFTAEAGGVYYFVAKNTFSFIDTTQTIDMSLARLDSDEGQLRVNGAAFSSSQQKK